MDCCGRAGTPRTRAIAIRHQRSIGERGQLHDIHAIFIIVAQRVRRFDREPRLADAAGAGDRQQPPVHVPQPRANRRELVAAAHQRRRRQRHDKGCRRRLQARRIAAPDLLVQRRGSVFGLSCQLLGQQALKLPVLGQRRGGLAVERQQAHAGALVDVEQRLQRHQSLGIRQGFGVRSRATVPARPVVRAALSARWWRCSRCAAAHSSNTALSAMGRSARKLPRYSSSASRKRSAQPAQVRQLRWACASQVPSSAEEAGQIQVHGTLRIELHHAGHRSAPTAARRACHRARCAAWSAPCSSWRARFVRAAPATAVSPVRRVGGDACRFHGQIRQQRAHLGIGEAGHRRAIDGDLERDRANERSGASSQPFVCSARSGKVNEELPSATIV